MQVDPEAVLPTVGSKELVALLPLLLGLGPSEAVVFPRIAYPSYAGWVRPSSGQMLLRQMTPQNGPNTRSLSGSIPRGNPDGRVLGIDALCAAVTRARELGAVVVGDECYAEFGWDAPWNAEAIPSLLDPRVVGEDHRDVLAIYSLSKQSNLAGYRAAFLAGDQGLVARILTVRKHAGLMVPGPRAKSDDRGAHRFAACRGTAGTVPGPAGFAVSCAGRVRLPNRG